MEDAIGIEDFVRLTDHDPHHVRNVLTAFLIENHRRLGSGIRLAGRDPLRNVHHDVRHAVGVAKDQHLAGRGCRVLLGARGVGVHGERFESGGFSVESDGSGDGRCGERYSGPQRRRYQRNRQAQPFPCHAHARLLRQPDSLVVARRASRHLSRAVGGKIRFRANSTPDTSCGQPSAAIAAPAFSIFQHCARRRRGLEADLKRSRTRSIRRASGRVAVRAPPAASASPPPPRNTRR